MDLQAVRGWLLQFEAIFFDFDGVIGDSELTKAEIWKRLFNEYGISEPGDTWYQAHIGRTRMDHCVDMVDTFHLSVAPAVIADQQKAMEFAAFHDEFVPPIEPMVQLVKRLYEDNVTLGVASSQHRAIVERQLEHMGIRHCFRDVVSCEDDCPTQGKPNPRIYQLAAERLNVDPHKCAGIEDTESGHVAVADAGMFCIGFENPNSGRQNFPRADLVLGFPDVQALNPLLGIYRALSSVGGDY
ncbi:MAG TPA: HAD family phosphatase [Candidatus Paceibacterota bacterium]|nr:HAD family phosphatase [Candidatus Paceibacterota bacterium]